MTSSTMSPELPPQSQSQAQAQAHTRVYQACIPCRTRKVKCDLGPVDNPHDPPCGRCRREQKHCFFSSTRRKRKTSDGEEVDDADGSDYERRNARKKTRGSSVEPDVLMPRRPTFSASSATSQTPAPRPITPGGSEGRPLPLRRPTTQQSGPNDEETNDTTGLLQREEIFSGHDALLTLSKAAEMNARSNLAAASYAGSTPGSHTVYPSPGSNGLPLREGAAHNINAGETVVDPTIYGNGEIPDVAYQDALKAWSRFRFVRAGWITAREAMLYMDYFFKFLSPLTPIVVSRYQEPSTHLSMLTDDPMLAMTILVIASRFHTPEGPGGLSRGHTIHDTLWRYLQGMIDRMIWGQEQNGGLSSSINQASLGSQPASDVNPMARKGLRTLGTVESLMLLTEWHPRALHFPAGNDDDELMAKDEAAIWANVQGGVENGGDQRIYDWLEPCWRSDRICWMLLGNAMTLAYEIGVFDEKSVDELQQENPGMPLDTLQAYLSRKEHLKDLILIYVTQTSGRVGITSMLPRSQSGETFFKTPDERLADRMRVIRTIASIQQNLPGGVSRDINALPHFDVVIYLWMEIAAIMEAGNQEMFANRRHTRDLIRSGKYSDLLLKFQPLLLGFKRNFESCTTIPEHMRHVLKIEYEYNRVYLNSLALQAVVERCISNTPMQAHASLNGISGVNSKRGMKTDGGAIPLQILHKYYGPDRHYISEVSSACREVLKVLVDGLYPGDFLKHAPVRTYFRIISVSIILLKTFALGATAEDIMTSIDLMKNAAKCMKNCIVDDVHIGNRFAGLLSDLTDRVRTRLQVMKPNTSGNPSSRAGSPPPLNGGAQAPMMPPPQPMQTWPYQPGQMAPTSPDLTGNLNGRSAPPFQDGTLQGMTTEGYEPNNGTHSIMPPPYIFQYDAANSSANGFDFGDYTDESAQLQEWMALPLDPLFRSYNGADVGQTPYGPDVGGKDFLDVLLQQDMNGPAP